MTVQKNEIYTYTFKLDQTNRNGHIYDKAALKKALPSVGKNDPLFGELGQPSLKSSLNRILKVTLENTAISIEKIQLLEDKEDSIEITYKPTGKYADHIIPILEKEPHRIRLVPRGLSTFSSDTNGNNICTLVKLITFDLIIDN